MELAEEAGITLVGSLRGPTMNLYARPGRIVPAIDPPTNRSRGVSASGGSSNDRPVPRAPNASIGRYGPVAVAVDQPIVN